MKILICSDGTPSAQTAIDLVGLLAGPLTAETTLLGIAEKSEDEQPLREARGEPGAGAGVTARPGDKLTRRTTESTHQKGAEMESGEIV